MLPSVVLLSCLVTAPEPAFLAGGCGGAYFLAEPGPLQIHLTKRDRNRSGAPTELRAILFGPDRTILQEVRIPFAGGAKGSGVAEPQFATLSTVVQHRGVYGLNVTVSTDRYGNDIIWGFATNCPKYLIETSGGHRDARHEEPIPLLDAGREQNVCFRPRAAAFDLELASVPGEPKSIVVYGGDDRPVGEVPIQEGKGTLSFPADPARAKQVWRLNFPKGQAVVVADGLTRWDRGDPLPDQCLWSPSRESWFEWPDNRWLLTPYRAVRYGAPGAVGAVTFEVFNNAATARIIDLALEFDGPVFATLDQPAMTVPAGRSATVKVSYTTAPAGTTSLRLRATPRGETFSTWSSLRLTAGEAPAAKPLSLPLQLQPYDQLPEQFGYAPSYPMDNQPYFSADGRAAVRTGSGLARQTADGWRYVNLADPGVIVEKIPDFEGTPTGMTSQKVVFDSDGDCYIAAQVGRKLCLLHSTDDGQTFRAYLIPGREDRGRGLDLEQFSGHNLLAGPPPIAVNTAVPTEPDPKLFWRRVNALELFVPRKVNGRLEIGDPIPISPQGLGLSGHSGTPSAVVSRGDKVHIVWGEATDPNEKVAGVPTFVATYDKSTGTLGPKQLIGYGAPANDVHNTPSITMDSRGYLYAVTGTHGRPFWVAKSKQPNDASAGFEAAVQTGENLSQTYIGLVCGQDDVLHLAYRLNRSREAPHPLTYHTALTWQRKPFDGPWSAPQLLVLPPFGEYSIYYHRLTIDPAGRLYLSTDYWSTFWFYRNDTRSRPRHVLVSDDNGGTWRLW